MLGIMEVLRRKFYIKLAGTQTDLIRDFVSTIDWSDKLIGIKGSRGVGKTTLILQYLKQNYKPDNKVLYISLDDLYFQENTLYDLAEKFYHKGGLILALDEVHRYENWAIEIKNIYDDFSDLKIIFTGSSLLHIQKARADLSRRAVMYQMPGLSLREFILFETGTDYGRFLLKDLISDHVKIAADIIRKVKPLAYFNDYLNFGYYPFYKENIQSFHIKLESVILTVLEVDIPQFASIQPSNILYLKKLLRLISRSVPFKPNMNSLSERTGISLNTMKQYIKLLNDAEILQLLYVEDKSINSLNKPEKIYLGNPNLMHNLYPANVNTGNLRETFFFNQIKVNNTVNASKESDFLVNNSITFEIGGKNKTRKQITGISNSYIIKDDIEIGVDNIIPLWLFGFLY